MKIVIVVEHFRPYVGGVEQLFGSLADALIPHGHELVVVTSRYRADLPKKELSGKLKILRTGRNRFWFTFFGLWTMLREVRTCDLVHTTSYNAALPAWLAARLCNKPVIVTFHEFWGKLWFTLPYMNRFQRPLYYVFEQLLVRLNFNVFVGVSNHTSSMLLRNTRQEVARIYNGLDYEEFAGRNKNYKNNPFTFAFFGRAGSSKGLDLLMPAAEVYMDNDVEARFCLIVPRHNTEAFRHTEKMIRLFRHKERLDVFHNLDRSAVFEKIQQADCVVIPSYNEGFCFAAAEAVALGLPVISSGRGALPEVVGGKFIHLSSLTVPGLVDALNLAKQGRWHEKPFIEFHLNTTVHEYIDLYLQIAKPRN
jgi:glycosyltransferase involved in cell wall biosynthesis